MRCTGLVAPRHVGSSQIRARNYVPCIGRRILNLCATREVPSFFFLRDEVMLFFWFTRLTASMPLSLLPNIFTKIEILPLSHHKKKKFFLFPFFFKINLFIYLLAVLILPAARGLFSSCREWGLLFVAVRGLLTAVASHRGGFSC